VRATCDFRLQPQENGDDAGTGGVNNGTRLTELHYDGQSSNEMSRN
jgi:hypothetical protein